MKPAPLALLAAAALATALALDPAPPDEPRRRLAKAGKSKAGKAKTSKASAKSSKPAANQWPYDLFHNIASPPGFPETNTPWPTNTDDASRNGWVKVEDEECNPALGEAWLHGGERSDDSSVTLYFSPWVDNSPGQLIGLEVDYFGAILDGLVGSYFSPQKTMVIERGGSSSTITYHSVAVGFRDSSFYNLCDSKQPLASDANTEYIIVAPEMARLVIPTHEESPDLINEWSEGSCIQGMGFHWFKNVIPGVEPFTYKSNMVVPVVPMYHPDNKNIAGLFFWAPEMMQNFGPACNIALATQDMSVLIPCLESKNFWDPLPGLSQVNELGPLGPTFMCANTCDRECYFEDSVDGIIQTMHFFFHKASELVCPPGPNPAHSMLYCRNGFDFSY